MEGHVELQKYRYFYFIITLAVYLLIIFCNTVIIFVIYTNKCLHEPMYIFIAAFLFNSLFGTTVIYPKLLSDFLSERPVTSYSGCMFQGFCIYTYGASEFGLLAAMAFDRYVSICKPLQYATLIFSVVVSVEYLVIPPLINPIMYGLKLQEISSRVKKIMWKRTSF
ncbi:olfactory receptor 6N1-like [Colossoma macropomum]|uniref:olfactory receptor 6N1-like n=1 Tax=Colossoma macropomum TaxID=42526 RepID=UPI0018640D72|nr:olfactory receptor 6N1-like [Colossoma macropomum]